MTKYRDRREFLNFFHASPSSLADELFPRVVGGLRLPDCLASEDDWHRVRNRDIRELTDDELVAERIAIQGAYARMARRSRRVYVMEPNSAFGTLHGTEWCLTRLEAIKREIARRRSGCLR